jgi:hypothetical protein
MRHRNPSLAGPLWLALGVIALLAGPAGATISGVCPDGSMFIVQREVDIPCAAAKRVAPDEMPPIKPEYLPRPYAWEVYQEQQDPNNPYNLVDKARAVRAGQVEPDDSPAPPDVEQSQSAPPPIVSLAPPPEPAPPVSAAPPAPAQLTLSPAEKRDLALIVELTQERVPASFERPSPGGAAPALMVRLAHSPAFEARLHGFWAARGEPVAGPVVLFSVEAAAPGAFWANFTFTQGHTAFHANADDPRQMGLIDGSLGPLAAGDAVLGYVALPAGVDVTQPMDVYWNDRRLVATLRR